VQSFKWLRISLADPKDNLVRSLPWDWVSAIATAKTPVAACILLQTCHVSIVNACRKKKRKRLLFARLFCLSREILLCRICFKIVVIVAYYNFLFYCWYETFESTYPKTPITVIRLLVQGWISDR